MRRLIALAGLAGGLLVALSFPVSGIAAKPVVHEHFTIHDTFADNFCGIDGTSVVNGVGDYTEYANGTYKLTQSIKQIFTATASGKSLEFQLAGPILGAVNPIDNGDGTVTFVTTFKGLAEKIKVAHGPTLPRDAGVITLAQTFDAITGDFISFQILSQHGPHPEADSNGALLCEVVVPALT